MTARGLTWPEWRLLRELAEDLGHEFSGEIIREETSWSPVGSWWARVINGWPRQTLPGPDQLHYVQLLGGIQPAEGPRRTYWGRTVPCVITLARDLLEARGRRSTLLDATCTILLMSGRVRVTP